MKYWLVLHLHDSKTIHEGNIPPWLSACKSQKYATSHRAKGSEIDGDMPKKLETTVAFIYLEKAIIKILFTHLRSGHIN